jgi:hypothetical protein
MKKQKNIINKYAIWNNVKESIDLFLCDYVV